MTPLLKKPETKGLLSRARSDKDERNLVVTITDKGEVRNDQAAEIPVQIAGCTDLTPEEGIPLYKTLYKLLGKEGLIYELYHRAHQGAKKRPHL